MLNKAWPLLLCKLNRHDWQIELRGHAYKGSVYPIRFRTCKKCGQLEQEFFDKPSQTTIWRAVKKSKRYKKEQR